MAIQREEISKIKEVWSQDPVSVPSHCPVKCLGVWRSRSAWAGAPCGQRLPAHTPTALPPPWDADPRSPFCPSSVLKPCSLSPFTWLPAPETEESSGQGEKMEGAEDCGSSLHLLHSRGHTHCFPDRDSCLEGDGTGGVMEPGPDPAL